MVDDKDLKETLDNSKPPRILWVRPQTIDFCDRVSDLGPFKKSIKVIEYSAYKKVVEALKDFALGRPQVFNNATKVLEGLNELN